MCEITFEEICEIEPEILRIYKIIRGIEGNNIFDRNGLWYGYIKPIVCFYVGFNRSNLRRYAEENPKNSDDYGVFSAQEFFDMIHKPTNQLVLRAATCDLSRYADRRLETSEAYEVVYKTLYDALP